MSQIGTKLEKTVPFSGEVSVRFDLPSQNVLKSDLKNPRYVQFGAILTHFSAKSGTPGVLRGVCVVWQCHSDCPAL